MDDAKSSFLYPFATHYLQITEDQGWQHCHFWSSIIFAVFMVNLLLMLHFIKVWTTCAFGPLFFLLHVLQIFPSCCWQTAVATDYPSGIACATCQCYCFLYSLGPQVGFCHPFDSCTGSSLWHLTTCACISCKFLQVVAARQSLIRWAFLLSTDRFMSFWLQLQKVPMLPSLIKVGTTVEFSSLF